MTLDRTATRTVGLGLLALGALALVSPAVERLIPTEAAVEGLGNDYLLVAAIGAISLAGTVGILALRTATGVTEARPPAVEAVERGTPGRELDAALAGLPTVRTTARERAVHGRLRAAAVASVAETARCDGAEARERVDRGEWTDDETAAAFVASDDLEPPSLARRALSGLRGKHWFRRRVDATVAALERRREDRT